MLHVGNMERYRTYEGVPTESDTRLSSGIIVQQLEGHVYQKGICQRFNHDADEKSKDKDWKNAYFKTVVNANQLSVLELYENSHQTGK